MIRSHIYPCHLPLSKPGMTIGLYGGSFNPPHEGHLHVAQMALTRLGLDRLWCLVTPGNPLKDHSNLAPLSERLTAAAQVMDHPRIDITGIEAKAGTRFTAQTLDYLHQRKPGIRFVWVMGADNLQQFHKWQRWQAIMAQIPVAIIDRPGYSLTPLSSLAARRFASQRLPEAGATCLARTDSPAWTFLHGPRSDLSSTALRRNGAC